MTKPIVKPVRPSTQGPAKPVVRGRKAPPDMTKTFKPEAGELSDCDLGRVSGGARISKSDLLKL